MKTDFHKEYELPKWVKIFLGTFISITGLGAIALCYFAYTTKESDAVPVILFVAALLIIISGLLSYYLKRWRLLVSDEEIYFREFLSEKSLRFVDVFGWRITRNYFVIEPKDKMLPKLKIDHGFRKSEEFFDWLDKNFKNLDAEDILDEIKQVEQDQNLGNTSEEKQLKLQQARRLTSILNGVGFTLGLLLFFSPFFTDLLYYLSIAFPIGVYLLYRYGNGFYRINERQWTIYNSLSLALVMPILMFSCKIFTRYHVLDYIHILISWLIATSLIVFIYFSDPKQPYKKEGKLWSIAVHVILFAMAFSLGLCIFYNCYLDNSKPAIYRTIVAAKPQKDFISFEGIGPIKSNDNINVSPTTYHHFNVGDSVLIEVRQGKLGSPWFRFMKINS